MLLLTINNLYLYDMGIVLLYCNFVYSWNPLKMGAEETISVEKNSLSFPFFSLLNAALYTAITVNWTTVSASWSLDHRCPHKAVKIFLPDYPFVTTRCYSHSYENFLAWPFVLTYFVLVQSLILFFFFCRLLSSLV